MRMAISPRLAQSSFRMGWTCILDLYEIPVPGGRGRKSSTSCAVTRSDFARSFSVPTRRGGRAGGRVPTAGLRKKLVRFRSIGGLSHPRRQNSETGECSLSKTNWGFALLAVIWVGGSAACSGSATVGVLDGGTSASLHQRGLTGRNQRPSRDWKYSQHHFQHLVRVPGGGSGSGSRPARGVPVRLSSPTRPRHPGPRGQLEQPGRRPLGMEAVISTGGP